MNNYVQGFIIAAIGVAVGYGIAVWTAEPPETIVIEREVPFETIIEPNRITDTDLKLLTDSMHPMLPDMQKNFCYGDYENNKPGSIGYHMCNSVIEFNKANHAALPVLTKLVENDLVEFVDGVYADEP